MSSFPGICSTLQSRHGYTSRNERYSDWKERSPMPAFTYEIFCTNSFKSELVVSGKGSQYFRSNLRDILPFPIASGCHVSDNWTEVFFSIGMGRQVGAASVKKQRLWNAKFLRMKCTTPIKFIGNNAVLPVPIGLSLLRTWMHLHALTTHMWLVTSAWSSCIFGHFWFGQDCKCSRTFPKTSSAAEPHHRPKTLL